MYIFLTDHGTFSKIGHILGHKASLNKYQKLEITSCIMSDHNGIKLDLSDKRNSRKYSNTQKLNNTLLQGQCIEEIREEITKFLEFNENESTS
jgi:hypothetical protein